ncbi:hypothetical protein [uncultured Sulfitobacter sp.]|mgnify:CR=1 FL=1|uniref:hypothetical protein n=1 Tax=uncultured Sulfitobacter sp. TaxID=191468 RepID=UPI0030DD3A8D
MSNANSRPPADKPFKEVPPLNDPKPASEPPQPTGPQDPKQNPAPSEVPQPDTAPEDPAYDPFDNGNFPV